LTSRSITPRPNSSCRPSSPLLVDIQKGVLKTLPFLTWKKSKGEKSIITIWNKHWKLYRKSYNKKASLPSIQAISIGGLDPAGLCCPTQIAQNGIDDDQSGWFNKERHTDTIITPQSNHFKVDAKILTIGIDNFFLFPYSQLHTSVP
jgi:hypothetical protein